MNIKSLRIVYENCESCKIYKRDIVSIEIKDIGFIGYKYDTWSGSRLEGKMHTSHIEIVVKKNDRTTDFGRSDVCHIVIEGKNGDKKHFVVDWAEDDDSYGSSSLQSVKRDEEKITFKSVPENKKAS